MTLNARISFIAKIFKCIYASIIIFRDNIEPSVCNLTSHKFVMHTFDIPTVCYHCSKYLKGYIFQVR